MKVTMTKDGDNYRIDCRYDDDSHGTYADVYTERGWIRVITDEYEGAALLHIEGLPHLIKALTELAKARGVALLD